MRLFKSRDVLFLSEAATRMCKSRLILESLAMASELSITPTALSGPGITRVTGAQSMLLTAVSSEEASAVVEPKAESKLDKEKSSSKALVIFQISESWWNETIPVLDHVGVGTNASGAVVAGDGASIGMAAGEIVLLHCRSSSMFGKEGNPGDLPGGFCSFCCFCRLSDLLRDRLTVERDLASGILETPWAGSAACFGLPTFFCCPVVHSIRRIVHRTHLASFRFMR